MFFSSDFAVPTKQSSKMVEEFIRIFVFVITTLQITFNIVTKRVKSKRINKFTYIIIKLNNQPNVQPPFKIF